MRIPLRLALLLLAAATAAAQEHPKEHPTEHPKEQAATPGAVAPLTPARLAEEIEEFIEEDMDLKGGWFLVYDTVDKKPLQLTLVRVHQDKLAHLGDEIYFACTDMKTADGAVYDLDFMMERRRDDGDLVPHEITVHKKAGVARYGWKEVGGTWTRVKP